MLIEEDDRELIEEAREIIRKRYRKDWHGVGAALRTKSGKRFSAVCIEAYVGRISVCAEAIAIGMGAAEGDTEIDTIVAVNWKGEVVSPCGMCREMISDYAPEAKVIVPGGEVENLVPVGDLLPNKFLSSRREKDGA
ncbi:MAG: cytidine deaminase [Planctomycetota bacterium]